MFFMCEKNNEIQFDYSEYNKILWKKILEVKSSLTKNNPIIYKYNWETAKAESIKEETMFNKKTIDYYWIEFEDDGQKLKISAFYKDFDTDSGNLHVILGKLQVWKQSNNCFIKDILNKATFRYQTFAEEISGVSWMGLESLETQKILEEYGIKDFNQIECREKMCNYLNLINNESVLEKCANVLKCDQSDLKKRRSGGKLNDRYYSLIRWISVKNKKESKSVTLSDHKIFFDNNKNVYYKYGEIQICVIDSNNLKGPNIKTNTGWELYYPGSEFLLNGEKRRKEERVFSKDDIN